MDIRDNAQICPLLNAEIQYVGGTGKCKFFLPVLSGGAGGGNSLNAGRGACHNVHVVWGGKDGRRSGFLREELDVNQGVGVLVFMVVGLVVAAVLSGLEIRSFLLVDRTAPPAVRMAARNRLVRRGIGALMLAGVVVLARYLVQENVPVEIRLARMGGCLALCVGLFGLSIWDFRIVRREIQGEFQGLQEQSLEDLQKHLERVAVDNPSLARQLPELLSKVSGGGAGAATEQTVEAGK